MSSEIPQVGDDGDNGAKEGAPQPPEGLTPEQIAEIRQTQAVLQQQGGQVAEAPEADEPVIVSELDRVKAENLHLKLLITAYKVKDAQQELQRYSTEQRVMQTAIVECQAEIAEKYSIDLTTHEIQGDTGEVIPRGQSKLDFGQLMQRIAQQGGQAQP